MRFAAVLVGALMISGCASTAQPNLFNGRYYMAGDKDCRRIQAISGTRIMCIDKKGNLTGYRDAMTPEDLQIYGLNVLRQQAEFEQLGRNLDQLGQVGQNYSQQFAQQSQQYTPPQAQPIAPYGTPDGITYRRVGDSLIGSNGVTYRQVGSSIVGSDGTKCQIVGQNVICN